MKPKPKVLYVVVSAAPPASNIHELVALAQKERWEVCVIATPHAQAFIDVSQLEEMTGYPVRIEYRMPSEVKQVPEGDAIIVIPATFNTINKWAMGIADNLAVTTLCEALGAEKPIVAVPYLKQTLSSHPAFGQNIKKLKKCGVRFFGEPLSKVSDFPWNSILHEIQLAVKSKQQMKIKRLA